MLGMPGPVACSAGLVDQDLGRGARTGGGLSPLWLIAAYSLPTRAIGNQLALPWHHPEDLKFFRQMTLDHAVIMGRRSFEALGRKPLPRRTNIVVSRQPGLHYPGTGVTVCRSLPEAIDHAARSGTQPPFVIGGGEVYRQAIPLVTRMYLTEIRAAHPGDAFFPEIVPSQWREQSRRESDDGHLVFLTLDRVTVEAHA